MWLDCEKALINFDRVDYVLFEDSDEKAKATVFFQNGDTLDFYHSNIEVLKSHFKGVLDGQRQTGEMG